MPRSDDLRHTLHDPDYWLGLEPSRTETFIGDVGACIAAVILTGIGIGGWLFVGWLLISITSRLGL